jgi:PIN domain nuclease of toxin-antitoxin system
MRGFATVPFPFSLRSRLDERGYLEDTNDEVYVSRASLWEMAIKVKLGKNPYTSPIIQYISVWEY